MRNHPSLKSKGDQGIDQQDAQYNVNASLLVAKLTSLAQNLQIV